MPQRRFLRADWGRGCTPCWPIARRSWPPSKESRFWPTFSNTLRAKGFATWCSAWATAANRSRPSSDVPTPACAWPIRASTRLGTAGAVRLALPMLKSEPVLVINGDSFCRPDLASFFRRHEARRAAATLLLTRMPDTRHYGRVQLDDDGLIRAFAEKGEHDGPGWINAGVYLLSRQLLAEIPEQTAVSLEREIFPGWLGRGLYGCASESPFLDIGTPASYAVAEEFFSARAAG